MRWPCDAQRRNTQTAQQFRRARSDLVLGSFLRSTILRPGSALGFVTTWRECFCQEPLELVDDHVLNIWQAGPAEVKRHSLASRRPVDGRPEVVNDQSFSSIFNKVYA